MKKMISICAGLLMLSTVAAAQEIRSFTATDCKPGEPDRSQSTITSETHKVQLNWTLLTEKSIQRFDIERSQDNEHYRKVQSIPQHFFSTELQQFSCTDVICNVGSDIYYYRLRIINKPGIVKVSPAQVVRINKTLKPTVVADLARAANAGIK